MYKINLQEVVSFITLISKTVGNSTGENSLNFKMKLSIDIERVRACQSIETAQVVSLILHESNKMNPLIPSSLNIHIT